MKRIQPKPSVWANLSTPANDVRRQFLSVHVDSQHIFRAVKTICHVRGSLGTEATFSVLLSARLLARRYGLLSVKEPPAQPYVEETSTFLVTFHTVSEWRAESLTIPPVIISLFFIEQLPLPLALDEPRVTSFTTPSVLFSSTSSSILIIAIVPLYSLLDRVKLCRTRSFPSLPLTDETMLSGFRMTDFDPEPPRLSRWRSNFSRCWI